MINKSNLFSMSLMLGLITVMAFFPESAFAQVMGGGFESKMQGLTTKLITVILPLVSVLGLVYAVILALTGDGAAKGRIIMVIVCSIVGFMAPHIIGWFQSSADHNLKLKQSIVHRKLDSKLKIVGLEIHDLLFVLLFAAIMNLIFGQTAIGFYLVFVIPSIMAAILFIAKRNKPDGYLVHVIKYYTNTGAFSAGSKGKNNNLKQVRINESKFKR